MQKLASGISTALPIPRSQDQHVALHHWAPGLLGSGAGVRLARGGRQVEIDFSPLRSGGDVSVHEAGRKVQRLEERLAQEIDAGVLLAVEEVLQLEVAAGPSLKFPNRALITGTYKHDGFGRQW